MDSMKRAQVTHGADHRAGNRALRPFLKWAGGKRQLLPRLREFYPPAFGAYHEPFLGSAAVFFDLAESGALQRGRVRLTDVNADLIGCCLRLRDEPHAVVRHLRKLEAGYAAAPEEHYYRIRDEVFNPARAAITNGRHPRPEAYSPELAGMLIYLNRTGYNGLFRLNSSGLFNVPRGRYKNPRICDEENLVRVSSTLSELSVKIELLPFETVVKSARKGDFVYFDPPYAPLSATAHFTSYTSDGFDTADQRELQRVVFELVRKGCHVVLSNSTAPEIKELYTDNAVAERLHIKAHTVPARRAINSNASRRGHVDEYIITNVPRRSV
ncbi:MAG: Dam family site-specific DNA-(adenine-N6)-methyltransferase [Acidobacteria bacterium]|nr:Dam family site-specific DNA-(adenine-N6)-methyltransferase [Acidobacteriota bacterium]